MKIGFLFCALILFLFLHIQNGEGGLFKKIARPFEKLGKEVHRGVKRVGKELERSGKKVGKELERGVKKVGGLVDKVGKELISGLSPLNKLNNIITRPIFKLLDGRKQEPIELMEEVEEETTEELPDGPEETFQEKILRMHNEARSNFNVKDNPTLSWDPVLSAAASQWASSCSNNYQIFEDSRKDTYGQNIYPVVNSELDLATGINTWYSFKDSYDENTGNCLKDQNCYPFLQMIWPVTKYIGCGQATCPKFINSNLQGSILVCFYTPL